MHARFIPSEDQHPSIKSNEKAFSCVQSLQERVGAVLGHDAVGLALLGLVLGLKLVAHAVVDLREVLLGLEGGNATGAYHGY